MIDSVRLAWAALLADGPPTQLELSTQSLRVNGVDVLLAIDRKRRLHFLVAVNERASVEDHGGEGFGLEIRELVVGEPSRRWLELTCFNPDLNEVFDHFVVAVCERLELTPERPVVVVTETLDAWRRFLKTGTRKVTAKDMAALLGELLMVRDVVFEDSARNLGFWRGATGARHDLRSGPHAIEVKTTRSHTARVVTIHGEDQLLAPDDGDLHLHFVRLEEVPNGELSVPSVVQTMIENGVRTTELFDLVGAAGLDPIDFPVAEKYRFNVRERLTYLVSEDFPRIVPESFAIGSKPVGVGDVQYEVNLDHATPPIDDVQTRALLSRMVETPGR